MYTCIACHFATELDDAVSPTPAGRCLCLRCRHRGGAEERPMPKALRRDVQAALAALDTAA